MPELVIPAGTDDRLDRVLPQLVPGLSRGQARRLIAAGAVFVDGRRCRVASRPVRAGARLRVEEDAPALAQAPAPAAILYEDDACLAVDKPAGMPAAPTRTAAAGTALDELRQHLRRRDGRPRELWPVHRIDRETSGILLFAFDAGAAGRLGAAFADRRVEKEYRAWVAGVTADDAGTVRAPLRAERRRAVVDDAGRAAETHWWVIERQADRTLLRVVPITGRMHQIRAHLAAIGHAVIGDRVYGGPRAARLMLHASRLRFPHPRSGEWVEVRSSPPW